MAKAKVVGISAGSDGAVWCVDSVGFAYKMQGKTWRRNPEAKRVREITVGSADTVWCRNDAGDIFKLRVSDWNSNWTKDSDAKNVQTISAGTDGTVWIGNEDGKLFMYVNNSWKENPKANAQEVSVGKATNVWCRNEAGKVFKLKGNGWDGDWDEDGQASWAQSISAAFDETMWLSSADPTDKDRLFKREGPDQWDRNTKVKAVQVSVGSASKVYCVDEFGQIRRLTGSGWNGDWTTVPLPDLPNSHLIKKGETLGAIVQDVYKLTGTAAYDKVDEIVALNGLEDADEIKAGDSIALA